jgi:hypothetical protein
VHEPPPFPDDEPPHDEPHEEPPPVRHERRGSIGFWLHAPASYHSLTSPNWTRPCTNQGFIAPVALV